MNSLCKSLFWHRCLFFCRICCVGISVTESESKGNIKILESTVSSYSSHGESGARYSFFRYSCKLGNNLVLSQKYN